METREKIVEIVKRIGPVLPVQISKEVGMNILMASAHLAELTASKRLKISTIKVGGSPLYYLQGQEAMLQKFTSNMNDKEKKAYDLLEQEKILRDSEQQPVIRVALREIKDFALPLNVKYNDKTEIFWKWYLSQDEEVEKLIKAKLQILEKPLEKVIEEKKELKQEVVYKQTEKQKQIKETIEKPKQPAEKIQKEKTKDRKQKEDNFLRDITRFLEKNKISIISTEVLKKNSEIDFIVEIPSVVGNLQYYCKAKNKKKISDSDLSNAYVRGQLKKLPVLVLSSGEPSTKAQQMLANELSTMAFKKV